MASILNSKQFERLRGSIDWSNIQLEFQRKKRIEAIKQFTGYHYSEDSSDRRVIVPFVKLAVAIYLRLLAAKAPRCLITTKRRQLKSTAANLELAVNEIPKEIGLQNTLKDIVLEALFSFGVAKVGLADVGELMGHRIGEPFVDCVTLDNLVIDMSATNLSQIQYIGNDYWMNHENVVDGDAFPSKVTKDLDADNYTTISESGAEKAEGITQDEQAQVYKKKILLRDIWLPEDNVFATYAVKSGKLLDSVKWTGPELGPYHILGFDKVPGNLLPVSPVSIWRDLHELANRLYRKLGAQADAQKTVLGFSDTSGEAVDSFKKARDGDGIAYTGQKPEKLTAGGVESTTLAFFMNNRDLFSYFANNLDSLGGLGAQSDTVGQDKLISTASGAQLRDMAQQVIDFSKAIFGSLGYYEWNDLVRTRELERPIPGTDMSFVVPWNQESRAGRFDMYDLDIDVFSMQDDSPSIKLQKLGQIMQQYIIPLMPAIQEAGGTLNVKSIMEAVAKFSDFPEIAEFVTFVDGFSTDEVSNKKTPKSAPTNTTRTVHRVNTPGATDRGKSQILQQALVGGKPQQSEIDSLSRPSG